MKKIVIVICLVLGYSTFGQDKEKIDVLANQACECVAGLDIDMDKTEKSEEISNCISSAIMSDQIQTKFVDDLKVEIDSLTSQKGMGIDTLAVKGKQINIVVDENYEEIQEYMYDNCEALKDFYFTDNEKHENSVSDKKKAKKFYKQGEVAFQKGEFGKAVTLYAKAVKKDKKFAFAWDNLGYSYRKLGNFKEAIRCYKKSLELDPKGKMPLMNLGVAYELNNELDEAISAYKNYANHYPDDPESFYGIGRLHYKQKNYEPALDYMIQAFILYNEMKSPYKIDAEKHIAWMYNELKEKGNLEIFNKMAEKHNLNVNTED